MLPLLLDTCAVIWVGNRDPIAAEAEAELEAAAQSGNVLVSPISAWEIGIAVSRRKAPLVLRPDVEIWLENFIRRPGVRIAALAPQAALAASLLPTGLPSDPADRLLVAQARELDVPIVTRDRRILDYAERGHVRALAC